MRNVPKSCATFYNNDDTYINESSMYNAIRRALDQLLNDSSNTSSIQESCQQLVHHYFCYYYFPLCNNDTGNIIPVCGESCNLMYNNEECFNVRLRALSMLRNFRFPVPADDDVCDKTFLPNNTNNSVSPMENNCIRIEGIYICANRVYSITSCSMSIMVSW